MEGFERNGWPRDSGACTKLGATAKHRSALEALKELEILKDSIEIITCPGAMGESVANKCGFKVTIIGAEQEKPLRKIHVKRHRK